MQQFFDAYYSHVYFIVYEHFIATEQSLRQKGAHKVSTYRYINGVWSADPDPEANSSDEKQDRSGKDTGCKGLRSG